MALSMSLGLNGGGICSAEELVNAITGQKQIEEEEKAETRKANKASAGKNVGGVETADSLPI